MHDPSPVNLLPAPEGPPRSPAADRETAKLAATALNLTGFRIVAANNGIVFEPATNDHGVVQKWLSAHPTLALEAQGDIDRAVATLNQRAEDLYAALLLVRAAPDGGDPNTRLAAAANVVRRAGEFSWCWTLAMAAGIPLSGAATAGSSPPLSVGQYL